MAFGVAPLIGDDSAGRRTAASALLMAALANFEDPTPGKETIEFRNQFFTRQTFDLGGFPHQFLTLNARANGAKHPLLSLQTKP